MPMDFPDLESLKQAAEVHGFRKVRENEPEEAYRNALANHVSSRDFIESEEIRNKVGWDKFSKKQDRAMLGRKGLRFPLP
jgi:hypothetical protein